MWSANEMLDTFQGSSRQGRNTRVVKASTFQGLHGNIFGSNVQSWFDEPAKLLLGTIWLPYWLSRIVMLDMCFKGLRATNVALKWNFIRVNFQTPGPEIRNWHTEKTVRFSPDHANWQAPPFSTSKEGTGHWEVVFCCSFFTKFWNCKRQRRRWNFHGYLDFSTL